MMKPGAIIFVPDFYNLSVVLRHVLKGIYLRITGLPPPHCLLENDNWKHE